MKPLVIVSDLGHFKAFSLDHTDRGTPRLEIMEEFTHKEAHERIGEKLTDQAGRFGMGGERGSLKGYGEPHDLVIEEQRKVIRKIASRIDEIVKKSRTPRLYLSAPKKIHKQLIEELSEGSKKVLKRSVPGDFTKLSTPELIKKFGLN
ncbi:MAG: hypothetical protein D6726_09095 [Nitrospirae bacterium]|nr:MAG: hypothetical protein D6726_09095 [Nitrospirota bacterium]